MSYILHYQHDIFVSYAPVDNEALAGADKGWVTTLITDLKKLLGQKLGRREAYSLWMDDQLSGHELITAVINERLKKSATFLLILSPGYLESCRTELDTFLQQVGPNSKRIFVVEKDVVERQQKPEELQKIRGYPFWVKNADNDRIHTLGIPKPNPDKEPDYYQRLDNLACELAETLKNLKIQIESLVPPVSPPPTPIPKDTIFLAEVTDDLTRARDQVKRYLEQHGLQVLPSTPYYFRTETELYQALTADLQKSVLFVQLLSDNIPQRPSWMTTPRLQWEQAKLLKEVTLLQWHDSQLDWQTVSDTAYRASLEGCVAGMTLEEFQQYIIQQLEHLKQVKEEERKRLERQQARPLGKIVFINTLPEDKQVAKQVGNLLTNKHQMLCFYPLEHGNPQEIQEDLKEHLSMCDAVLLVYGNTPPRWLNSQIGQFFKIAWPRPSKPCIALCEAPPLPKDWTPPSMPFPMPTLNYSQLLLEAHLSPFISCLESQL